MLRMTVIVQIRTNNLRMDETEVMKTQIRGHDTGRGLRRTGGETGEVAVMGILPRHDLSEALDSKKPR